MSLTKKKQLERFKKTAKGLIELAILIEQADPHHRETIIKQAEEEDPFFLADVMRKVVYFDELIYLDEGVLSEILSKISPKQLAFALKGMSEDFRKIIFKHLGHVIYKQVLEEEQTLNKNLADSFVLGARKQILKIARQLEAENKFVLETHGSPRLTKK